MDLGAILRMRELLAAASETQPDVSAAYALTETYRRLRRAALSVVRENGLPAEEFEDIFREMPQVDLPRPDMESWQVRLREAQNAALAQQAAGLLRQMGGWFEGIVAEQTLERRIQAEAAERAKLERKQPPGFRSLT